MKTWYLDVSGIYGFAFGVPASLYIEVLDQIMSRKTTPHKDEELKLFGCTKCRHKYIQHPTELWRKK